MATRGRFIPGQPLSVSQLNEMNRVADSGKPRVLGSSVDIASGESGMAIQPTGTPSSTLRILKVTGTVTGGYSFQEVYDPDGDGTYTDAKGYVSVGSQFKLVAKSGATLATNDIVVARLNPYNPMVWEAICLLMAGSGGTSLATQNTDGTQSGTTTDMRFDKSTGIQITQGVFDTVSIIPATTTQVGAITISSQSFAGSKIFTGSITHQSILGDTIVLTNSSGGTAHWVTQNFNVNGANGISINASINTASETYRNVTAAFGTGRSVSGSAPNVVIGVIKSNARQGIAFGTDSGSPSFDLYADLSEWTTYNSGPIRCRLDMKFLNGVGPLISDGTNWWRITVNTSGVLSTTGPL